MVGVVLGLLAVLLVAGGPGAAAPRATERVSVDSGGVQGNEDSGLSAISADGRYVAFDSGADNLVLGDTNRAGDVFVHDRGTGATERVSVDSGGIQGNKDSYNAAISAGGRYVAFESRANNLVPGDTNSMVDIFVHDQQTGITERVSVDSSGVQGNGYSGFPAISADGRYVAFHSYATNLVPGDTNGIADIFVHDRQTGTTERVSVDSGGVQVDYGGYEPAISADGRYVAFESAATNLVPGDTNGIADIFVHDRQTGITERVSVDSSGAQGNDRSVAPAISADGRYVAFRSYATNLVPGDTNNKADVFVHDRQTGITERVSVGSGGVQGNGYSGFPAISADGRYVAFHSYATNLVAGDTNDAMDVFVHDRQTGTTERVSVDSSGAQGNDRSAAPAISAGGRYVAFDSDATNLVAGDTNNKADVFVHDRGGGATSTPAPTPTGSGGPQLKQGDVDCDGDVDAVDALKVLRHVASLSVSQEPGCPQIESEAAGHPFGDVDCDNDVDAVDALKVLRFVASLPNPPVTGCTPIGGPLG